MDRFIAIREAEDILGASITTLRRREAEGNQFLKEWRLGTAVMTYLG